MRPVVVSSCESPFQIDDLVPLKYVEYVLSPDNGESNGKENGK